MPHSRGLFIKCKYNHNLDKKYHNYSVSATPFSSGLSRFPDLTAGWTRDPCQVSCLLCSVYYNTDTLKSTRHSIKCTKLILYRVLWNLQ